MIEDLLVTRYPELAAVQTSCHATHLKGERVIPCGDCSKCQGILLFLLAGGHDPARLRYHKEDVRALAPHLAKTIVKLERPEAEHAMWLAEKHGWTFEGSANGFEPRAHPELDAIRFNEGTSRRDCMPEEIADRVYKIIRTRAKGVREKSGDRWVSATL